MSKRNHPTVDVSGVSQKNHKNSSSEGKPKANKTETSDTKTTDSIISETSIKRQKAIKELANR